MTDDRDDVDPIAHTLTGGALAQAGLKERTALGTATLLLGANIPDVDVFAYLWGPETALWFRRGLTHGILAVGVWPFVLTGIVLLWDRWVRRARRPNAKPARPGQLLLLSAIAVISHPLLDFLNVYGIRLLAPFSQKWYYGDTLFIVDPWLWAILAAACWLARESRRWVGAALGGALVYILTLALSGVATRARVIDSERAGDEEVLRLMAAPVAVTPFSRWVVVETAGGYRVGMFHWLPQPRVELADLPYETQGSLLRRAASIPVAAKFLSWARFPYYSVARRGDSMLVRIGDARYTVDPESSWASTSVRLDRLPSDRSSIPP